MAIETFKISYDKKIHGWLNPNELYVFCLNAQIAET